MSISSILPFFGRNSTFEYSVREKDLAIEEMRKRLNRCRAQEEVGMFG